MKRPSMKRKTKQKDPDLDAESAETLIWTCSACGADNPDSKQACISCGGARAGDTATPKPAEPLEEQEPKELEEPEPLEASEPEKIHAEETPPEPTIFSFDTGEKNPEPPLPDQEVSRKHAELTMDGAKLMLKDLNSKNGTFLYNGKEFQQVHDSVEVKPNSIVKFGTGTIVRLTSE